MKNFPVIPLCTNSETPTQTGDKPRCPVTLLGQPVTWLPTVEDFASQAAASVFPITYCKTDQPGKENCMGIPCLLFRPFDNSVAEGCSCSVVALLRVGISRETPLFPCGHSSYLK